MRRLIAFSMLLDATVAHAAEPASTVDAPHVRVHLVAKEAGVQPGASLHVGLRFELEPEWHVYWRNPGDSGEAVRVAWTLPDGVTASAIEWPAPKRFPIGPLMNFGYGDDVLLPVSLSVPGSLPTGAPLVVGAKIDWLVCREECIPGKAELMLTLPVEGKAPGFADAAPHFANARAARPESLPQRWNVEATPEAPGLRLDVGIEVGKGSYDAFFFPDQRGLLVHAAKQTVLPSDDGFSLALTTDENLATMPARLTGVLSVDGKSYEVDAPVAGPKLATAAPSAPPTTLINAVLLAFLGGLILNAMPCVFPVLSIKAFGLLNHAHGDHAQTRIHGILYGLGVLLSFWALAGLLIALRAGGERIGWGFQLQSPISILALAMLLFAMGLNLAGLFEVRAGWVGVGQNLASRREAIGAFFSGVLATVVATPCTAPFMGTALGFAASQPAPVALAVFTSLALGLASPYVLLSFFPQLGRRLPKPGRWMETAKQFLAFPLFATVIWLLWVLGQQRGGNAVAGGLAACLFVAIAGWIYQRWQVRGGLVATVVALAASVAVGARAVDQPVPVAGSTAKAGWETYSPAALAELRNAGTPVFLDFTAAWCVTCKVNESVALRPEILQEMRDRGVTPMQADWTNDDPEITAALRSFGRDGVPLYVLYGARDAEPKILPQILTVALVREALDEVSTSTK